MATSGGALPKASVPDTLAILGEVLVPTLAKGTLFRRPKAVAVAERLQLDERAVRRLQKLNGKYGDGPLLLRIPFRRQAVILAPGHVHSVLAHSPEPFATASSEKRAALSHFEPRNVLISHGADRELRRRLHEQALDSGNPVHRSADAFLRMAREEADELLQRAEAAGMLEWNAFAEAWYRMARRVVFGDSARDDYELTDMLAALRANANWAFLKPKNLALRTEFLARVEDRMRSSDEGSLAWFMARAATAPEAAPADQIAQWLFGFDGPALGAFRTLALLATHPGQAEAARREAQAQPEGRHLPYLRACVLEALRLWPTTPMILRQTTRRVDLDGSVLPAKCGVLIYVAYFSRDQRHLPAADRFDPDLWLDQDSRTDWPLVPFSEGPAECPARELVLMFSSAFLARLLTRADFRLVSHQQLTPAKPLPGTLNSFALRFAVAAR
ncbi:cytochrome P450 [Arthrobacter crystallopoietes BAB-32]|uniref:Cytochrome P450 n=2 Tax=Crystallibacter crystallopoietes TaxID=37928 RepID=N1V3D0_9MICC|nr:cytochrome P450 [Arthrobacter crystallopoietes BAB-32]